VDHGGRSVRRKGQGRGAGQSIYHLSLSKEISAVQISPAAAVQDLAAAEEGDMIMSVNGRPTSEVRRNCNCW
jgi:hypothetical protein